MLRLRILGLSSRNLELKPIRQKSDIGFKAKTQKWKKPKIGFSES
jgi:hypothetical protein